MASSPTESAVSIKRILIGVSGTAASPDVIHHALQLGRLHDALLTLMLLGDTLSPWGIGGATESAAQLLRRLEALPRQTPAERAAAMVLRFKQACAASQLKHQVIEDGDLGTFIAQARHHDLMILGSRGELARLGEPAVVVQQVVSAGADPLWMVAAPPPQRRRVLMAYSGSLESARSMKRFVQMQPCETAQIAVAVLGRGDARILLAEADQLCRAHGLEVELLHDARDSSQLAQVAREWKADLVVIGTGRRRSTLRDIFGEAGMRLVDSADCDLFIAS